MGSFSIETVVLMASLYSNKLYPRLNEAFYLQGENCNDYKYFSAWITPKNELIMFPNVHIVAYAIFFECERPFPLRSKLFQISTKKFRISSEYFFVLSTSKSCKV